MEYIKAMQVFSEAQDYKEARTPTVSDAITLGLEAVRRSQSQDLYSYGLDMLVCLPEGIKDHHAELGDDFGRKLVSLREQYTPEAKTPKSGRPRSKTRK